MGILLGPLTILLAALTLSSFANAKEEGVVHLGGSCVPPGTSVAETLRILQAELSPVRVEPLDDAPPIANRVRVIIGIDACTVDPPGARVTVWTNGVPRVRLVTLADAQSDARDRTLALALAEATRDFAFPALEGVPSADATPPTPPAPPAPPARSAIPAAPLVSPVLPPALLDTPKNEPARGEAASAQAAPRAGVLLRFVAAPSTVLGGAELGVAWRRATLSVSGLATERTVSAGTATLLAVFASPSVDVIRFGERAAVRVGGELGLATGSGNAVGLATASSASAPHLALDAGIATTLPIDDAWTLDGFLGAGYASSLTLRAEGREVAGLGGFFLAGSVGVHFPWNP